MIKIKAKKDNKKQTYFEAKIKDKIIGFNYDLRKLFNELSVMTTQFEDDV